MGVTGNKSNGVVYALGLFDWFRKDDPAYPVRQAAELSFSNRKIRTILDNPDMEYIFDLLRDDKNPEQYLTPASGYFVQEALEGAHGITDIHMNLIGFNDLFLKDEEGNIIKTHTTSEIGNLIAALNTGDNQKVNIHFLTAKGLCTIKKGTNKIEGAQLPDFIYNRILKKGQI